MGRGSCWFCGKPAVETWHTSWDQVGEKWPMCPECSAHVTEGLKLRRAGHVDEADELDSQHGITTDNQIGGEWIPPKRDRKKKDGNHTEGPS